MEERAYALAAVALGPVAAVGHELRQARVAAVWSTGWVLRRTGTGGRQAG